MFDIAFSEMMVIAAIALIVIGPEKLPRVARTLGHLIGRMQRYVNDVKSDIQREVELDELRKLKESVEESARSIEQSVNQEINTARDEVREIESLAQGAVNAQDPGGSFAAPPAPESIAAPVAKPSADPAAAASSTSTDQASDRSIDHKAV
jgi:sec-independent protein translocase protein TatB